MYGLIVTLVSIELGLDDDHIYAFDSKEAAIDFAFERLVEYGCVQADRIDREEALDEFESELGLIEMFHIWPITSGEGLA